MIFPQSARRPCRMAEKNWRAMVEADGFAICPPATQNKEFACTCRSLQQKIEKLREERQVMRAVAHLNSFLDKQGMGGPGLSNREIADALRSAVRTEIYNKGFKSGNKYHLPPFIVATGQWHAAEMKRQEEAVHELDKVREKLPDFNAVMAQAMIAKGHQCMELTFAAAGLLRKAGIDVDMHYLRFEAFDHALLLIGKLPPDLARKLADWPPDLAVCDAWANIACTANQFVPNFLKKMDKWKAEGKLVHNFMADNWDPVPAADIERWMNGSTDLIPL